MAEGKVATPMDAAMVPVRRLGDALTVCRRCGVVRTDHPDQRRAGHPYEGLTQREAEAMVRDEATERWS